MMRSLFARYFSFFLAVLVTSGCGGLMSNYNTATQSQERTIYSTDQEQEIGASVARAIEKEYRIVDDPLMNARVDQIINRIEAVCDRQDLVYVGKIIESKKEFADPMINAVSLPGGYIYVFKGLMDYIKDDDLLASVIAHEAAHVAARHSIKRLQASYTNLAALLAAMAVDGRLAGGVNAATTAMFFDYSQKDELEADALGLKYMTAAGYDPKAMVSMLEKLGEYDRKQPIRPKSYGRTHPYVHQRIAVVNQIVSGELTFRDWVRSTGERGQ